MTFILMIVAFALFVCATIGWPASRFSLLAAGLAVWVFAIYLLPHF